MLRKIVVPELGESVLEATVGHWLKKEGDRVNMGEVVLELETDKVDVEVGAEQSGVLARIERNEGEDVRIGDVLGVIEEAKGGESGIGSRESETLKSRESGVGSRESGVGSRESEPSQPSSVPDSRFPTPDSPMATPSARRLARERGVDLAGISPSDESGRVTKRDVESHLKSKGTVAADSPADEVPVHGMRPGRTPSAPIFETQETALPKGSALAGTGREPPVQITPAPSAPAAPLRDRSRLEERVRMSRRRLTIARRLVEAQRTAAMLTTFNEVDTTSVIELRKRQKESFKEQHGVSLGIVSFFVKASIAALRDFPRLNAEVQGEETVLKHYYDIGVAVGASEGLVVPVLRDADRMSFAEIEIAIKEYAQKAEDGTLSLEDLRGGTFTITNGGVFGSLLSTPILNPPQVGILGLHKILERPITLNGQIVNRPMMYIALSYDHRIVDGSEAVRFLVRVKELVEDPGSLLLSS